MQIIRIGGGGYDFIAYLDDDDEWLPEKLEKQVAKFNDCGENTAMIFCDTFSVDEDTGEKQIELFSNVQERQGNVYAQILKGNFVANECGLIRTKHFRDIGGFDESMRSIEDWDAWIRLAKHYEFYCVAEPLMIAYLNGNREHVNADDFQTLRSLEKIISKNKNYLDNHKKTYLLYVRQILRLYKKFGERKNFFGTYLKKYSLKLAIFFENFMKGENNS